MKNNKIIITIGLVVIILMVIGISLTTNSNNNNKNETNNRIDEVNILKNMREEDISFDEKKINIYLFWGNGCEHCHNLSIFLSNLDKKTKSYFDLYTFETWYDEENQKFMEEFAKLVDKDVEGVPFLIIGSKVFSGYSERANEEIKKAIQDEFNKPEHFDYYKNSLK